MTERKSGAREWRLYIVAAIAGVYVLVLSRVGPKPAVTPAPEAAAPTTPARAVWLDELPADRRPAIVVPAGWRVAARTETIQPAAPAPRRVATPRRIRTRSS